MRALGRRQDEELIVSTVGASSAEYVLMVTLVALVAIGGFVGLGWAVEEKVDCAAGAIGGAGGPCGASAASRGSDPSGREEDLGRSVQALGSQSGNPVITTSDEHDRPSASSSAIDSVMADLERDFELVAGDCDDCDTFSMETLGAYAEAHPSSDLAAAYRALSDSSSIAFAADVGRGEGDVDGDMSLEDIRALRERLQHASDQELFEILGDTASGSGDRDGYVSRDDALALLENDALAPSVLEAARERIEIFDRCAAGEALHGCEEIHDHECGGLLGDARCWVADNTPVDELVVGTAKMYRDLAVSYWDNLTGCVTSGDLGACVNTVAMTGAVVLAASTMGTSAVVVTVIGAGVAGGVMEARGDYPWPDDEPASRRRVGQGR